MDILQEYKIMQTIAWRIQIEKKHNSRKPLVGITLDYTNVDLFELLPVNITIIINAVEKEAKLLKCNALDSQAHIFEKKN